MECEKMLERVTKVEEAVKSAQHQIDEMKELIGSIHDLTSELKYMRVDLNKIQSDIDSIKAKPMKRYELAITAIITSIVSAAVGFLISTIF